jgi:hypothetical protein
MARLIYPALSCVIEVDDVITPLHESLAQTYPEMLVQ